MFENRFDFGDILAHVVDKGGVAEVLPDPDIVREGFLSRVVVPPHRRTCRSPINIIQRNDGAKVHLFPDVWCFFIDFLMIMSMIYRTRYNIKIS